MEEWTTLPGYPDYEISSFGRVFSLKNDRMISESTPPSSKYARVQIGNRGKGTRYAAKVHSLVAASFLGPLPEGNVVHHRDEDPQNNHLENLVYIDYCAHWMLHNDFRFKESP